jgi:uncharacterized membrane protein
LVVVVVVVCCSTLSVRQIYFLVDQNTTPTPHPSRSFKIVNDNEEKEKYQKKTYYNVTK